MAIFKIFLDGKEYDENIGFREYDSNVIIADNEPVADSLNKIANYLQQEDFTEKRDYPSWQDFTPNGSVEYFITQDQNADVPYNITDYNLIVNDLLDFSVVNPTTRKSVFKQGSILNIESNRVKVVAYNNLTGKVTLNFIPKSDIRINFLYEYANNEVPIGKKLEVLNTEITVQNSDDASEIAYNNSTSALTSTDVQSAIDELVGIIKAPTATASAILDFGNEENYVTVDIADGSIVGNEKIFVSYEGAEEVALQGLNCGLLSKSVGVGYTIFGGAPNGASGQFTVNIIKL